MLGKKISILRKQKGLSQSKLGFLIGVSNKIVSKWETETTSPDIFILPLLAEVLGITLDELLTNNTNKKEEINQKMSNDIKESKVIALKDMLHITVPLNFNLMAKETIQIKYGNKENAPDILIGNEHATTTINFKFGEIALLEDEISGAAHDVWKLMQQVNRSTEFLTNFTVRTEKTRFECFDCLSTSTEGISIYNLNFFFSLNGLLTLGYFNCLHEEMEKWKEIFMQILKSIKILTHFRVNPINNDSSYEVSRETIGKEQRNNNYWSDVNIPGNAVYGPISIPSSYGDKPITKIADKGFYMCPNITSITIPEGIEIIGESAFQGCKSITEIIIPNSVAKIENLAFMRCDKLHTVKIPETVRSIGANAFAFCPELTEITLPKNAETGLGAFHNCTKLIQLGKVDARGNLK